MERRLAKIEKRERGRESKRKREQGGRRNPMTKFLRQMILCPATGCSFTTENGAMP
jgi:hypothetical protein